MIFYPYWICSIVNKKCYICNMNRKSYFEATEKKNGRSSTYLKFWIKSGEYTAEAMKALDVCQMMFHNMNVSLLKLVILKFAP